MELSKVEQAVLARFRERCHRAGSVQTGYGMRADAIRRGDAGAGGVDAALQGMVEKGWLKANPAGNWYYLTEAGAERVKAGASNLQAVVSGSV